jgi:beta-lactamase class A
MRPARLGWTAAFAASLAAGPAPAQDAAGPLDRELARIAAAAPAKVGIGVIHAETGTRAFVNGDEWFPMASTYKVPMAVEVLTRVDQGRLRLDSLVRLEAADLVPFGSLLTERFGDPDDPGAALSIRRYVELMLTLSDNTATDVLLRVIGGTAPVRARVAALGIRNLEVSRTVTELAAAWLGYDVPPRAERNLNRMRQLMVEAKPDRVKAASQAFLASHQDHTTPKAMAELLTKIARKEALSPASTETLVGIMRRDETGLERLRGRLPPNVLVASKTGTLDVVIENDVGIIDLPDGSHAAVAVYLKEAHARPGELDRVIADVGRAVYDYFTLARAGKS